MMHLTVNGKSRQLAPEATLLDLLDSIGINPAIVAVERNGDIVRRVDYAATVLAEGDRLEVVRMVGGG